MHHKKAWFLLAVLFGACAIPDVKIDDALDDTGAGATSSKGGTKSTTTGGKAGSNSVVGPGADGGAGNAQQGGEPSVAGTNPTTGGKASGSAGTRTGGGSGGSGGTGSVPPPVGAVAKFCNAFTYNGVQVNAELQIGSARIRADFGTCAPIVNDDCTPLAVGARTVHVWDTDNDVDTMINVPLTVTTGSSYIFLAYITNTGHYAIAGYDKDPTSMIPFTPDDCASLDFAEVVALSGLGGA